MHRLHAEAPLTRRPSVVRRIGHLVARFAGSLLPVPVSAADAAWVATVLTPAELALWRKMPRADRVESIRVARRAAAVLDAPRGAGSSGEWLAAALLHDAGKVDARFGPFRRAVATVAGAAMPRRTTAWRSGRGFTRRVALYLDHAALGADHIRGAGGREVAARWAAAHHDPPRWPATGIPVDVCRILAAADGEAVGSDAISAADRGTAGAHGNDFSKARDCD